LPTFVKLSVLKDYVVDSFDTEHSAMFDNDSVSGLGGWGNPDDDSQITTGGFKDITVAYPSRHRIRRTYTLQPLGNLPNQPFANDPQAPPVDPTIMVNGSFTKSNYDHALNGFLGNFTGFHAYVEGPRVCDRLVFALCFPSILTRRHRVLTAVPISSWEAICLVSALAVPGRLIATVDPSGLRTTQCSTFITR
jgi:hypothetical protein